ncbi:MAG TPA: helix-turn-helix domain-containing protein [Azonexus sp.]|nr:helix-turn-helix domain-containing protein [Azonexus sp.]
MANKKKAAPGANRAASDIAFNTGNHTQPTPTGQCAQVLSLIEQSQPLISFTLTADHAIPEAAARIHDLRCMGFNILTTIHPAIEFRGQVRRNVASYSLGTPAWPRPGFIYGANNSGQLGLDLDREGE